MSETLEVLALRLVLVTPDMHRVEHLRQVEPRSLVGLLGGVLPGRPASRAGRISRSALVEHRNPAMLSATRVDSA